MMYKPVRTMLKKRFITAIISISAFIIFIMLLSNSQSEGSGNYPYSGNGDWIIENETIVKNESFELNGSLIINENGDLKLDNVNIEVNSSEEYALIVEEGGKFSLIESSLAPSNSSNPNKIEIQGEMTIENSFVGFLSDNIQPEAPILEEIDPKSLSDKGTLQIKGIAEDNKGVKRVEVFISYIENDEEIKEMVKTVQFSQIIKKIAFETEIRLKTGLNSISVRAIDSSGNAGLESEKQEVIMIGGSTKEEVVIEQSSLQLNFKTMPSNYDWITIEQDIPSNLPENVIFHDVSWLVDSANDFDCNVKAKYEKPTHLYETNEEELKIIMSSSSGEWKEIPSTLNKEEQSLSFYTHFDASTRFAIVSGIVDFGVISIKVSNDPVLSGTSLEITAIIENSGEFVKDLDENEIVKIEFVAVETSSQTRIPIKTVEITDKFVKNAEIEVKTIWENFEIDGIFEILVIIDPYHEIFEINWKNNRDSKTIEIIDSGIQKSTNKKNEPEEIIITSEQAMIVIPITGFGLFLIWIKRTGILIPLYSRIKKEEVLNNKIRQNIHNRILANPGENFGTIKNALELNNGAVIHHLSRLEKEGFIKSQRDGMYRRFYPNGTRLPDVVEIQEEIRRAIQRNEGITQSEIAIKIGVSRQVVNYHVKLMIKNGTVRLQKNGRESKCFLGSN